MNNCKSAKELLIDLLSLLERQGTVCHGEHIRQEVSRVMKSLQPGQLVCLFSESDALLLDVLLMLAYEIAASNIGRTVLFTPSMSRHRAVLRMISLVTGTELDRVQCSTLSPDELNILTEATGTMSESGLLLDDTPHLTLQVLAQILTGLQAEGKFLSHVLVHGLPQTSVLPAKELQPGRALRQVARSMNVPVVVAVPRSDRFPDDMLSEVMSRADVRGYLTVSDGEVSLLID